MKNKKSLIKFIIIDIFLILCVAILFYEFYQSKKAEQTLAQIQTQQEERRKQEQLERQAQQEEQARQEQARIDEMQKSLPTKFDMRDKIKISVEHQGQKPFCTFYAEIKAREIALNYQGNYNYNFKKVYNYLKTAPNELKDNSNTSTLLKDLIGLDNNYDANRSLGNLELKSEIVNGKPLLIMIDARLSAKIGEDSNWSIIKSGYQAGSGHELVVIGYDDEKQSWLCLNSWGTNWGNKGTGWIEYDDEGIVSIGALKEITE